MLDMQTVIKMKREDTIKRNQKEKLERYKREIAFNKKENIKGFVIAIVFVVAFEFAIVFTHNMANKGLQECIEKKGEDYCVRKLG